MHGYTKLPLHVGASPIMLMPLLIYISFFLWMLVYALDLILGFNSGAVPHMGLHPVAPAPFGSCLLFLLFSYV